MRWGLDLLLSLVGALLGLVSVMGWLTGWEGSIVWLLMGVVIALVLGQFAGGKYFLNGFVTGIVASLISSVIVYAQYDTYFANLAQSGKFKEALDRAQQAGKSMSVEDLKPMMKTWMLIGAPILAAFIGAIQGLLALAAGQIFGKKPAPAAMSIGAMPTDDINNPPA